MKRNHNWRLDSFSIAFFCIAVLMVGFLGQTDTSIVRIFGLQIPSLCLFRWVTGLDCPACGLTRSLILACHGQFLESYRLNVFGIPFVIWILIQIPYQLFQGFTGKTLKMGAFRFPGYAYLVPICLLTPWTLQTIAMALIFWL
jgi:Protein of unknown function (DUF2752)